MEASRILYRVIDFFGDKYTEWINMTQEEEFSSEVPPTVLKLRLADHPDNTRNHHKTLADFHFSFIISDGKQGKSGIYSAGKSNAGEWYISASDENQAISKIISIIKENYGEKMYNQNDWSPIDTWRSLNSDTTKNIEEQLRAAIREELNHPSCAKLPRLCAQIATEQGRNTAEEWIFTQCATYSLAVQTAMSDYDSSLGE